MSFSLLSVLILAITATVTYREIKKGYRHGLSKSLVNLSILIFCAVFTSLVSMWIAKLFGKLVLKWMESGLNGVASLFPGLIGALISIIISILLYIPIFYILKAVFTALVRIIMRSSTQKLKKSQEVRAPIYSSENVPLHVAKDKHLGAAIGAISGIIISIVVFMPLVGCLKSTYNLLDVMAQDEIAIVNAESETLGVIGKYANDASGTVLYYCGGNVIYDLTTRIHTYGYYTCLNDEIESLKDTKFIDIAKDLYEEEETTKDNLAIIEELLDEVSDHVFLRLITTDIVKNLSSSWLEDEPFMGLARPDFGNYSEVDSVFNAAFVVCSNTTMEYYDEDIRTIISLISILNESPLFVEGRDYKRFMQVFVESDIVRQLDTELDKNPRMTSVKRAVDNLFIEIISSELKTEKYSEQKKNLFYKEIAAVLNNNKKLSGSVQKLSIKGGVSDAFDRCGVYLPEELEDRVADMIVESLLNDDNLTEKSVEEFFNKPINEFDQD